MNWAELGLGSVRRVTEDNVYKGFLIPAGATVIVNTWYAILFRRLISCNRLNAE